MTRIGFALLLMATPVIAQDTLQLPALHSVAIQRDPRIGQYALQERATALRLKNISVGGLPQLRFRAEASHQSEVPAIPVTLPGAQVPEPPKDRYSAVLDAEQLLYDGGVRRRRREAERAQLEVARADVAVKLYPLRFEVNEAFFTALLLQEQHAATAVLIEDLEARMAQLRSQLSAGAALPGDTAAVLAELLGAEQTRAEISADRRTALAVLGELTGRTVSEFDVLMLPDFSATVARAATGAVTDPTIQKPATSELRPEHARFAAQREQLTHQADIVEARARPQIVAFGQAGYGRPGFQQFTDDLHDYWLAGVRLQWSPWRWGETGREREVLSLQQRIVDTEEAAFTDRLRREVQDEMHSMQRLRAALATDERVVALRELVERQAHAQLGERAITAAQYVDIRTDLQDARIALQRRRVELARAQAQYLTTLGIELR